MSDFDRTVSDNVSLTSDLNLIVRALDILMPENWTSFLFRFGDAAFCISKDGTGAELFEVVDGLGSAVDLRESVVVARSLVRELHDYIRRHGAN